MTERVSTLNSDMAVRKKDKLKGKQNDVSIVQAGQIRRGVVGSATLQKKPLNRVDRPPSTKESHGNQSDRGTFLSSYH